MSITEPTPRPNCPFLNKDKKPFCYNCKTTEWKPITNLEPCCDEQKDKTRYPFLKSPDYAYNNDMITRLN